MAVSRILRIREVQHVTGLSRATIYRKLKAETFPQPVHMTAMTVGWREQDVQDWVDKIAAQPAVASAA